MKKRKVPSSKIVTDIVNLESLLFKGALTIPEYQRPYKWSERNVNQLIDDILLRKSATPYRIGTIVLHKSKGQLNIVDGQQRIFTLCLIAGELLKSEETARRLGVKSSRLCMAKAVISNTISLANLRRNHFLIQSRVKEFTKADILFFFKKCELVYIELGNISEAFQFFDSQNSRGKDLAPHDLLKAFHLREMGDEGSEEKLKSVEEWEAVSESLHTIFNEYLYRLRMWTKGHAAFSFAKDATGNFKGISLTHGTPYNFQQLYRISHTYIEQYNVENSPVLDFPFQVDQVIINGKRFFGYVHHYSKSIQDIEGAYAGDSATRAASVLRHIARDSVAARIMESVRTYKGGGRKGDLYVRNVFDCCLLYYMDKFGPYRLEDALTKFFLWSFALRLEHYAVKAITAQNLARSGEGFIRLIREAVDPKEVLGYTVRRARYIGKKEEVLHISPLVKLFKELKSIQN